jgi:hypothetical protein
MYERVSEGDASSFEKSIEKGVSDPLKTAGQQYLRFLLPKQNSTYTCY